PKLASQSRVACASMAWNTGSSSPGELEMTCKTSEVAACCSNAWESSRVSTAMFVFASASWGLRELRGAGRRVREGDPDSRWRLAMIARPVDEQRIMHGREHRAAEAAKYFDMPGLIWYRTAAAIQHPVIIVDFQERCSGHNSRSRRRRLRAGVPTAYHFARATYRACVARRLICIVRIVTPRKPRDTATCRQVPRRACSGDAQPLC